MPLAAAVIGSAVVGAGATLYSSSQAKKAANKATDAQNLATQQQLALQQQQFDRTVGLNQPFVDGGVSAYQRLLSQFGVAPAQTATTPATGAPAGSGVVSPTQGPAPALDPKAYLAANPDVMAEYQNIVSRADPNSPWFAEHGLSSPEAFAQWHYDNYGVNENRQGVPQAQPVSQVQTPATPSQTPTQAPANPDGSFNPTSYNGAPGNGMPDYMNTPRPDFGAAPTFTRPQDMQAPGERDYLDPSKFTVDPGYQFRLSEGINAVNAGAAARGKLRSGDAAMAIQQRGEGLANQGYQEWFARQKSLLDGARQMYQYGQNRLDNNFQNDRAYGTGLWENQRNFANNNFDADREFQTNQFRDARDYATNRYDTNTQNLFGLTRIGLQAAGNVSGAGGDYAANAGSIYQNNANAAGDNAYMRAAANQATAGRLAGIGSDLFKSWGGGAGSVQPTTVSQAWGFQQAPTGNVDFLRTPASLSNNIFASGGARF